MITNEDLSEIDRLMGVPETLPSGYERAPQDHVVQGDDLWWNAGSKLWMRCDYMMDKSCKLNFGKVGDETRVVLRKTV